jgi:hypothetical protein
MPVDFHHHGTFDRELLLHGDSLKVQSVVMLIIIANHPYPLARLETHFPWSSLNCSSSYKSNTAPWRYLREDGTV